MSTPADFYGHPVKLFDTTSSNHSAIAGIPMGHHKVYPINTYIQQWNVGPCRILRLIYVLSVRATYKYTLPHSLIMHVQQHL